MKNHVIREMVNEIKLTREFKELKQAINSLEKYKDIKKEIETLQKRQIELLNSKKSNREIEQQMKEIEKQFKKLSKHPEVDRMIKHKNKFNNMMNSIYVEISKALDLEIKK